MALCSFLSAIMMIAAQALAADIATVVNNQPEHDNFQVIGVNELAKLIADPNAHVHLYDANVPGIRASQGLIPGARPLSSDDQYDVAGELPTDKNAKLVFYCANLL
jgi:hypothetical protein